MNEATKTTISKDIQNHPIILYIKGEKDMPMCGFSHTVVQIFKELNVDFETRNVLADENLRSAIKEVTNWPTIPQVFINGEFIGGCDILVEMYESGELKPLIEKLPKR